MKPVIVFDMNETLLDISALDPTFARIFGVPNGAELRTNWFRQVVELFLTATITGEYRTFDKLTDAALQMLAMQHGRTASAEERAMLKEAQAQLPAHPDVRPGLVRLKAAGFRLAVLSNSTEKSARSLLKLAGLDDQLEKVISADTVARYKPAREAYEYAATELGAKMKEIVLVAAHAWDVAGAMAAGCEAAFVDRPRKVPNPEGRKPHFQAGDMTTLAEQIVAKYGG